MSKCERVFQWDCLAESPQICICKPAHFLFGLCDAVALFNDENGSILDILKETGIEPGHYTTMACQTSDCCNVRKAARNLGGGTQQARKKFLHQLVQ